MTPILAILVEHEAGRIKPITFEVFHCARTLQSLAGGTIQAVIVGSDMIPEAEEFAQTTGLETIVVQVPGEIPYHNELWQQALAAWLALSPAAYICIAHSSQGSDLAPGLAVRLQAACITAVENIAGNEQGVTFRRSCFGGKIHASVQAHTATAVLTVLPGMFSQKIPPPLRPGTVRIAPLQPPLAGRLNFIERRRVQTSDPALAQADVIVAAGRGIGKKENLTLVHRLASLFPKAVVGCSRPLCDLGWLEYRRQVGLTGATVAPRLYIACGISGTSQHVAGMREAGLVVAINIDPYAAIFDLADIGIVEDLTDFIPLLIEAWEKRSSSP